ncbi:Uncharacterised protein [Vibrio cholerae]|nr:Uncharacterised protein [Vibrio cholerae]CSI60687.1 Uncharacterised protein [Vibrio cholerae]
MTNLPQYSGIAPSMCENVYPKQGDDAFCR